ncbi:hypothetical protein K469DRAFT_558633 [Zopfia rhizophila CBS 207.26]|uniref:DUF1996 domain-containing protein n=1 Tax=Zopfia rhizophila CBS 207.26 TaxID=1314779 RepID=A0A6A6EGC3_9PEZI|nr:hypothetical protein K469DRAFT_558633 [Zopfia rhizophila CBS 207.26]
MYTNLLALTAGLAATASAFDCTGAYFSFYNRGGSAMSYQRSDPALFPGVQSPHLHSFDGGNALSSSMDFETIQSSSCTTARIKPDKSLYWRPTLYWNGNNTGFYRVPDKFVKIYYKFGDAGNVRANVTEFPENFKMIAGNPFLRHDDGVVGSNKGPGIMWSCKGKDYKSTDAIGFPKGFTSCPEGFTSQITFPACWNGNDIDSKNPGAHMAWPTESGKGLDACPKGFKVARFPTIFVEFWYDVSAFDGHYSADSIPWVLSNGDSTGYGFHADFLNGWEKGVLAKATAETGYCNCGCGCGTEQMKTCFGAENVNEDDDPEFKSCQAKAEFPGDDKSPLDKLPGCNPVQNGPADATQASGEGCAATPIASGKASSVALTKSSAAVTSAAKSTGASKSTGVLKADISISLVGKQEGYGSEGYGNAPATSALPVSGGYGDGPETTPAVSEGYSREPRTTSRGVSDGGSLGLIFSDEATNPPSTKSLIPISTSGYGQTSSFILKPSHATTASPAQSTSPAGEEDCKAPVYITITPTVYVTADAVGNVTSCDENTVYTTVTNTATVTVPAGGYKHKRHADLHKH